MPPLRFALVILVLTAAVGAGAVAAALPLGADPEPGALGESPAPRVRNTAPQLVREVVVAAGPGRVATAGLSILDPEGDPVEVEVVAPVGLTADQQRGGRWSVRWAPADTGTETGVLRLTDGRGGVREVEISLRSTNPHHGDTVLGLGDSVASGHGLQKRDYLGRDGCWRSEREAYPWLVREGLVERGLIDADGGFGLVACSGATIAGLLDDPVSGGPDEIGGGDRSQVEWAIAANPGIVTLTIGANTLRFTDPWNLLDGDAIDRAEVDRRLGRVADDLDGVLRRLVDHTDSTIYVTNYFDPTANEPQGIEGCEGDCFRRRAEQIVGEFNQTIAAAVTDQPSDRVVLVDIASAFEGHGAPNGLGPDGFRAGAGWLRDLVGAPLEGVHPYCADGHDDAGSWINYVDCVHPDGRGHREIAAVLLDAMAPA